MTIKKAGLATFISLKQALVKNFQLGGKLLENNKIEFHKSYSEVKSPEGELAEVYELVLKEINIIKV